MKYVVSICIVLVVVLCSLTAPLKAQEDTILLDQTERTELETEDMPAEIEDIPGLRAEFKQGVQDPDSKVVPFEMILSSSITSDRVRVTWTLKGESAFADESQKVVTLSIQKGKTYSIPINVIPVGEGISELTGKVESFELGNAFVVTVRKNYASNVEQEILPLTNEYNDLKSKRQLQGIVKIVILSIIFLVTAFFGLRTFLKWYDKDEVKAFESNQ